MTSSLPPIPCTYAGHDVDHVRCGKPGVARYTVRNAEDTVYVVRCATHDPAAKRRFEAKVGGLVDREELDGY